ncbi:helix-turn-helix transcriptional regulator [Nocardioides taihuensis]|uniref:Helix-turn-helix transcriptional regulator n=1 Tax=Nocardioides taihuensis TaxID=1835606 RepID=A0ABW0BJ78_9ACTN
MTMSSTRDREPDRPPASDDDIRCERLWSLRDVSAFLGVPIGTLYQWRVRGEGPPAFKLGRQLRFDPDRVRAWLRESAG